MPADAALLATSWRGTVAELRVRGHIAVVDHSGRVVASAGDPHAVTTMRSCVKPLQALPFVRDAADAIGAVQAEIAIACASHDGDTVHVEAVRGLLARAGVDESRLACGPQLPFGEAAATRLLREGGTPLRVHHNCSGKHAGMLATCAVRGWPLEGYLDREHPCQAGIRSAMASVMDVDLDAAPWGVDGCGAPTYGVPLSAIARGFAAAAADPAFARCGSAMAARPELVAGEGRFDTVLLRAAAGAVTAKSGAAAVWAALWHERRLGIAIKLEAGAAEALPAVAVGVLSTLGAIDADGSLERFREPRVRNAAGLDVGSVRAEPLRISA